MTAAELRASLLAFEGAYEHLHHDHPDFRGPNGIFAGMNKAEDKATLALPLMLAEQLEHENPGKFRIVWRTAKGGWLQFELAGASLQEIEPLIEIAWEHRAK